MAPHKLVILGDAGVGKTALTVQFCFNHFDERYDPTIEDSYRKEVVYNEGPFVLDILDTAGLDAYVDLWAEWARDGEGFMLVYSITSHESSARIIEIYHQVRAMKALAPIMLVGNKSDCEDERVVSFNEGHDLAKKLRCGFFETSAKSGLSVDMAFFHSSQLQFSGPSESSSHSGAESAGSRKNHRTCCFSPAFETLKNIDRALQSILQGLRRHITMPSRRTFKQNHQDVLIVANQAQSASRENVPREAAVPVTPTEP